MNRRDVVFSILGGFFLTNAVIAEMVGGKIVYVADSSFRIGPFGPFAISVGILPWPIVFITTDLVNEYFGKRGVRRLTFLTAAMLAYTYIVLALTMSVPAAREITLVDDASYRTVFSPMRGMIVASLLAFLISQLVDVTAFHLLRKRTGKALIWLRATGSTILSQLIDSIVVLYVGVAIPAGWTFSQFASVAVPNYMVKLAVAVAATPLIYAGHWAVERYLGKSFAEAIAEEAAAESRRALLIGGGSREGA